MNNLTIEGILKICELHAKRLRWAVEKLRPLMPSDGKHFASLPEEEILLFELFSSRFAKLQDLMGAKLFGLVLELAKETGTLETFIDKLNRLEKIGAIPSAKTWLDLREIRNDLSHEYPDNPDLTAHNFNQAFTMASVLLDIYAQVKSYTDNLQKRLLVK